MAPTLSSFWTHFHPPKPTFTDSNIPNLQDKVYIVTGSNTGIGFEVARILYAANAKVYLAARSPEKAHRAIASIHAAVPSSLGDLIFLSLDLSDLNSVKAAAKIFLAQERTLHVLFNNAGLTPAPIDPPPKTTQGYELALGVNCIGTLLFTRLLTPTLAATAKIESLGSVRVVWLSSFALELFGARDVGVSLDNLDYHIPKPAPERYGISKSGVWALGVEFARRYKSEGVASLPINPGNLSSELAREQGLVLKTVARMVGYPPLWGAYTELWAALSHEVTLESSGDWGEFDLLLPIRLVYAVAFATDLKGRSSMLTCSQWRPLAASIRYEEICLKLRSSNRRVVQEGRVSSGTGRRNKFNHICD